MGAAEDTTAVRLPADPPAQRVNGVINLPAARNHCPGRNCSPWYRYAQTNGTRSAGVKSQQIY